MKEQSTAGEKAERLEALAVLEDRDLSPVITSNY